MFPSLWIYVLVLFDLFAFHRVCAHSTTIISTKSGPVRGKILRTIAKGTRYSAFVGIPYAKPPLDELRFKPPVPIEPWTTTLNATTEGNVCPQIDIFTKNFTGDENCLFINVFTPVKLTQKSKTLKNVMVWIYGGSFKSGSSNTSFFGPDFLIEHDVVFVSFNYRIGALGFLSLNHPNATGNAGLKDQNLALKWVRNNIKKFGGDPQNVTIFGQSAGGVSVDFHILSDLSRGLFQRAISMSGSPLNIWGFHSNKQAEQLGERFGKLLGYKFTSVNKDTLLNFLHGVSSYDLVMAAEKLSRILPLFKPTFEKPNIAGKSVFISECAVKKYASGNFSKVPYMMGVMAKESLAFADSLSSITEVLNLTTSLIESMVMKLPSNLNTFKELISSSSKVPNRVTNLALQALVDDTTDILFKYQIDEKQRSLVSNNSEPIYYYEITFDPDISLHQQFYNIHMRGAAHGDELAYIFYMPAANITLDPTDPISITRNRMTRMWTNFAKYGNPTPDGTKDPILNITWPSSNLSGTHLQIDKKLSIGARPINTSIRLLQVLGAPTAGARNGCPTIASRGLKLLKKINPLKSII